MDNGKRLRSLDEIQPLPWHRSRAAKGLGAPMILALVIASRVGALIGLSL